VGQTATLTYTVQVADTHGGSTTQNVVVTITGTNDAPVITSGAQTGAITERAGLTGSTLADTASGAVTLTDADLSDTHNVTVTGVTTSGTTSGLPNNATLLSWLTLGSLTDSTNGLTGSDSWSFSAQELRLPSGRPDCDPDLHGAGRRHPWRIDHTERGGDHYRH
jgi:hypothetical protein